MKKIPLYLIIGVSVILIIFRFGYKPVTGMLGISQRAGLKITTLPEATVFINDQEVGKTPFSNENLSAQQYKVRLSSDSGSWEGLVQLFGGTVAIINREIAPSIASSSGEILMLSQGQGVVVASTPNGSEVEIDGKSYGITPLTVSNLEPGEHTFLVSHNGYLKRNIKATLPANLLLRIDIDLAINDNLVEQKITAPATLNTVSLLVKQTPTGFLRVRSKPSTQSSEVGRVSAGERLTLVEELSGWMKVKLASGVEGYIASNYVQKTP